MPRSIDVFMGWCLERGIEIDPRLEVRLSPLSGSISVFSRPGASIDIGESCEPFPALARITPDV